MRVLNLHHNHYSKFAYLFALLALIFFSSPATAKRSAVKDQGVILNALREINMSEPDVIQFENTIVFRPGAANKINDKTIFEYVVAADYADTLVDLEATNADTNYPLKVSRAEYPLLPDALQASQYNATDFLWFRIDVSENFHEGAEVDEEVRIDINEYHKRRREAFPKRLSLLDEQTMRVGDSRYLLTPYSVHTQ